MYLPGDTILITDIGATPFDAPDPGQALVCNTTHVNTKCCRGIDGIGGSVGGWYFPDGTRVPRGNNLPITMTAYTRQVRLNRRSNAMAPTGRYVCRVHIESNFGLVYNAPIIVTLGECSTLYITGADSRLQTVGKGEGGGKGG